MKPNPYITGYNYVMLDLSQQQDNKQTINQKDITYHLQQNNLNSLNEVETHIKTLCTQTTYSTTEPTVKVSFIELQDSPIYRSVNFLFQSKLHFRLHTFTTDQSSKQVQFAKSFICKITKPIDNQYSSDIKQVNKLEPEVTFDILQTYSFNESLEFAKKETEKFNDIQNNTLTK